MTDRPGPGSPATTISESVPGALEGQRIDRVVSFMADISRREAAELVTHGAVSINGVSPAKASSKVRLDDVVSITVPERDNTLVADPGIAVDVVFADDHVLVLNKPPGLVVHPGAGTPDNTMVNGLLAQFPEIAEVGEPDRPGIVHRLDKGTSGLLMVARTQRAYEDLVGQLMSRTVLRRYRTAVEGIVESNEGLIDAPLGRSPRQATRRAVVAGGKTARTLYEVIERYQGPELSLLTCRLETGRTHQIRAHLEAIGHPVVGDVVYGATPVEGLDRPFLHAELLGFSHPSTGEQLEFEAALPEDLAALLTAWQAQ